MAKKFLTKLVSLVSVFVLLYSIFWFFKAGQLEKHINNFVANNSPNVSLASFDISGYPLQHKVTVRDLRFSLPFKSLEKSKIVVKKIEATSEVFQNEFMISVLGDVIVFDKQNQINNVEFMRNPKARLLFSSGRVSEFSYDDFGYRVFDVSKNVVYAASSSSMKFFSRASDDGQVKNKIKVKVRDIEGLDVAAIYKNIFENRVIDAIKTGKIRVAREEKVEGVAVAGDGEVVQGDVASVAGDAGDVAVAVPVAAVDAVPVTVPAAAVDAAPAAVPVATKLEEKPAESKEIAMASQVVDNGAKAVKEEDLVDLDIQRATNEEGQKTEQINSLLEINEVKNDLIIDLEYILTPENGQNLAVPTDPTQIRNLRTKYNRSFKVSKLQLANSLYKININGQVNMFQDDALPSGFVTIRLDNISNLTKYLQDSMEKIALKDSSELLSFDASLELGLEADSYRNFLRKVAAGLDPVSKEIAAKNQLSQDDVAVYDMRREKNLDFVVNETPLREILGRF